MSAPAAVAGFAKDFMPVTTAPVSKEEKNLKTAQNQKAVVHQGHSYQVLNWLGSGVAKVSDALTKLSGSVSGFQYMLQFTVRSLVGAQIYGGSMTGAQNVIKNLTNADEFIDATRFFPDGDYFINGGSKENHEDGRGLKVGGMMAIFVADICCTANWLFDAGIVNLGKLANSTGVQRVFGGLTTAAISTFGLATVTVGFAFLAGDALNRIVQGKDVTQAGYDLLYSGSEIVYKSFILMGGANPTVYVALGLFAASTAMAAFLNEEYSKKAVAVKV